MKLEMKSNATTEKKGLMKFGFIPNKDYKLEELSCLMGAETIITEDAIDALVDGADPIYLNSKGWDNYKHQPIALTRAAYQIIATSLTTEKQDPIYGFFVKDRAHNSFRGIVWATRKGIERRINIMNKFRIGEICFDTQEERNNFLEEVVSHAIKETWTFENESSSVSAPILLSYLEHIIIKLRKEAAAGAKDKLIYNSDGNKVMFNTNLLDIFSRDIIVMADVRKMENGDEYLIRPELLSGMVKQLKAGFSKNDNPAPPEFFQDVRDVVFQTNWAVDENFDTYRHIIEDRRYRFPQEYQNRSTDELARKLKDAIEFSKTHAKRNYKFVVPMYRPQLDAIQLLMPIFLSGNIMNAPDFSLVLTPNQSHEIYEPETILPLNDSYKNARLIAKPDETWLNPGKIFLDDKETTNEE